MNPTKFHRRSVFSHAHAALFRSSRSSVSTSPISRARGRGSCTTAIRLKCVSSGGYRAMRRCSTSITFSGNVDGSHAPWLIGCGCKPSSSYSVPLTGVYAMKWYTSAAFSSSWGRVVSSANGLARAKVLCAVRMASELERASPRSSGGNPVVKSLKERSSLPSAMGGRGWSGLSWLRITERMAWVPQAFWIVWAAKKTLFSVAVGSYVPSSGASARAPAASRVHLKRKITP